MGELISCLCVSQPHRYGQLQRTILSFSTQTYDEKELIIVVDNAGDYVSLVQSFVDRARVEAGIRGMHVIARPAKSQAEGLAFAAIHASGEVLTLWDDDCINLPDRLKKQMQVQAAYPEAVTVYGSGMYAFWETSELFVLGEDANPNSTIADRTLPSSLMAFRRYFPTLEPNIRSKPAEMMLINTVRAGRKVQPLASDVLQHIVGVTNNNLRGYEYHRQIAQKRARSASWLAAQKETLTTLLSSVPWDTTMHVEGSDGGAYDFTPTWVWPGTLHPINLAVPKVEGSFQGGRAVSEKPQKVSGSSVTVSSQKTA